MLDSLLAYPSVISGTQSETRNPSCWSSDITLCGSVILTVHVHSHRILFSSVIPHPANYRIIVYAVNKPRTIVTQCME